MELDILGFRRPTVRPIPDGDPLPVRAPLTPANAARCSLDYRHVAFAIHLEQTGRIGRDDEAGKRRRA
jgi:hypothetical protein